MNTLQLNAGQKLAAANIRKFLTNPSTKGTVFTLTGGPGTGKTFMLSEILKPYAKGDVQAVTVSHAAKNILQESLGQKVICTTISSLLGMGPDILEDGNRKFVSRGNSKASSSSIGKSDILIIDEVSQIDDDLYNEIVSQAFLHGVRIIAVGDPYQLPPVEQETDSKFFDTIDARLTESMRFQGPIAELAEIYRTQIDNINVESGFDKWALNTFTDRIDKFAGDTGYGFTNQLDEIIERVTVDIKEHPETASYARILAFKNDSVAEINRRVRFKLYGEDLQQFEDQEIVICNGGYSVQKPMYNYTGGDPVRTGWKRFPVLYNGQILKVRSHIAITGPEDIPCRLLSFEPPYHDLQEAVYVVDDSFEAQQKFNLIKDKKFLEAKEATHRGIRATAWKSYYSFLESFANFDYAYGVNLYKAQGQTLNNVYVCEGEVMGVKPLTWKQKFQALYVAMTRAKEKLFIYNREF